MQVTYTEHSISTQEPTFSVRLLWPFARLLGADPRAAALLDDLQLSPDDLVLDQRIPCRVAFAVLERAVALLNDPLLGLRAGAYVDEGTFGVLERAASKAKDLGAAIDVMSRHLRVINEAAEVWRTVHGSLAHFRYAPLIPHPPAANDLAIASSLSFMRRHCAQRIELREVWVMHPRPAYADAYAQLLNAPARFSMPANALVFDASALTVPMRTASPSLAAAFERHATGLSRGLVQRGTLAHRVRERLVAQLADGAIDMGSVARSLRQSTPTLRRKLQAEGASFSDILEDVRKEAAQRYLLQSPITVTEVARLLGFSHVRAFTRAFQRWTGKTPSEFRSAC